MKTNIKLTLKRLYRKPEYIIGKLFIDGEYFCDTIEDRDRGLTQDMSLSEIQKIKVYGETAIPYGIYKVALTYSPKFKKQLPEILEVPGFQGIRIHSGNTLQDSLGCVLLGKNTIKGKVTNSKYWTNLFIERIKNQKNITIEIIK